ncbi:hypothetical protein CSB09_04685 [Candidatus Gracilibacteria bacterium]|nr:MAG: hypothetical protein CSB09_04685 [Candidatus Gracilibacteria bacterium]
MNKTTKSVRSGKKPEKDSSTQRYLPFTEIHNNMLIMKDGSSRMVLKIHALNFNLKSVEEQDAILISYQRFLNTLNFPIQIIVRSLRVDIESYINRLKKIALNQESSLLQEQTYKYVDFLTTLIDLAQIMRKDFYIVVPYDIENDQSVRRNDFVGIFQSFWSALSQEQSVSDIRANRIRAQKLSKGNAERVSTIKMSLEGIGLKAEELKKEDLIRLVHNYYNPKIQSEHEFKSNIDDLNFND